MHGWSCLYELHFIYSLYKWKRQKTCRCCCKAVRKIKKGRAHYAGLNNKIVFSHINTNFYKTEYLDSATSLPCWYTREVFRGCRPSWLCRSDTELGTAAHPPSCHTLLRRLWAAILACSAGYLNRITFSWLLNLLSHILKALCWGKR